MKSIFFVTKLFIVTKIKHAINIVWLFLKNSCINFSNSSSSITYILLNNSHICAMSSKLNRTLFWRVGVNTFKFVYMTLVLLKWNSKMLMKYSQSSSRDVVHVFMSSFSEMADAEITTSVTRFIRCSKQNARLRHSFTRRHEHAGFIFN